MQFEPTVTTEPQMPPALKDLQAELEAVRNELRDLEEGPRGRRQALRAREEHIAQRIAEHQRATAEARGALAALLARREELGQLTAEQQTGLNEAILTWYRGFLRIVDHRAELLQIENTIADKRVQLGEAPGHLPSLPPVFVQPQWSGLEALKLYLGYVSIIPHEGRPLIEAIAELEHAARARIDRRH